MVLNGRVDEAREGRTEAAERLVRFALPADLDRDACRIEPPGEGELYLLRCPAAGQPDGFPAVTWTVHAGDGAEAAVAAAVRDLELPELDAVFSCGGLDSSEGWVQLSNVDDEEVGRLACSVDADGDPQLRWYWADIGVLGFAELRGGGAEALSELQSWWTANADRGF